MFATREPPASRPVPGPKPRRGPGGSATAGVPGAGPGSRGARTAVAAGPARAALEAALSGLKSFAAALDPHVLDPSYAAWLVKKAGEIESVAAGIKMLAAGRVASSGAWRTDHDASAAHWLARNAGSGVGEAGDLLKTATRLEELQATKRALLEGEISPQQAKMVAGAAERSPSSETDLLDVARTDSLVELRDHCARVRAASVADEAARAREIHASRYLRHHSDDDGGFCLRAKMLPEHGAMVLAALEPYRRAGFEQAKKNKLRISNEGLMADALVDLSRDAVADAGGVGESGSVAGVPGAAGGGAGAAGAGQGAGAGDAAAAGARRRRIPPATIFIHVDYDALVRGHCLEGEVCEIPGVGPIPAAAARALANDAAVSVILTKEGRIASVVSGGRYVPARLKKALMARYRTCGVKGCGARHRLENDHIHPFTAGGPTCMDNLWRLCPHHHFLKTYCGWRAVAADGEWDLAPPVPP